MLAMGSATLRAPALLPPLLALLCLVSAQTSAEDGAGPAMMHAAPLALSAVPPADAADVGSPLSVVPTADDGSTVSPPFQLDNQTPTLLGSVDNQTVALEGDADNQTAIAEDMGTGNHTLHDHINLSLAEDEERVLSGGEVKVRKKRTFCKRCYPTQSYGYGGGGGCCGQCGQCGGGGGYYQPVRVVKVVKYKTYGYGGGGGSCCGGGCNVCGRK